MAQAVGNGETREAPARGERLWRRYLPPPAGALGHTPHPHGSRHGLFSFALRAGKASLRTRYARITAYSFGIGHPATFMTHTRSISSRPSSACAGAPLRI